MARVLIVNDSPPEAEQLGQLLKTHGHTFSVARDGSEGVALAAQEQPDLVLMDVVMPGLNGFQATEQIKKNSPSTRVVFVSRRHDATDEAWALRKGAERYLTFDALPAALQELLDA